MKRKNGRPNKNKKQKLPNKKQKLAPPIVQKQPLEPPKLVSEYAQYDLDLLITAYNVHSVIKHTPRFSRDLTVVTENSYCLERQKIELYIVQYVKNKAYFKSIVADTQKDRDKDRLKGVKWYIREDFLKDDEQYHETFI